MQALCLGTGGSIAQGLAYKTPLPRPSDGIPSKKEKKYFSNDTKFT